MDHGELIGVLSERPQNFAWLLGAGTSRSAGLPTATDIIWDLKRRYYCREENQEITRQDIQNEAVASKIQDYMLSKGFPPAWSEDEYSTYFKLIFGDDYERQAAYLNGILSEKKVSLSVGNRVLGALMTAGHARVVFTTNFDSIVEKSVAEVSGTSLAAYHLEGTYAANDALANENYPIYCKLHGDFRYRSIKNLPVDLESQNEELGRCFVNACNRFGLVVTGYSGRDASVMALLKSVLKTNNPFPHGLVWTGLKHSHIPTAVEELMTEAKACGVRTHHVPIETFDAFMLRLWRNIPNKKPELDAKVRKTTHTAVSIPIPPVGNTGTIVRINALPLIPPSKCLLLELDSSVDLAAIQEAEKQYGALLAKHEQVWMWGKEDSARKAFGDKLIKVSPYELEKQLQDLRNNLHLKTFLEKALARSLAMNKPLLTRSDYHRVFLIADRKPEAQASLQVLSDTVGKIHGDIPGLMTRTTDEHPAAEKVSWAEAAQLSIEEKNGRFWLVIHPDIWIWPKRARREATYFLDKRKENRFNEKADHLLTAWCKVLLGESTPRSNVSISPFEDGNEIENPVFQLSTRTAYSRRYRK